MTHWIRRAVGLALVFLTVVPLFKLLPARDTGATGRWTAETVSIQADLLWSGAMVLAIVAVVAGMLVSPARAARWRAGLAALVLRPSRMAFAMGAGVLSAIVTAIVVRAVFENRPNLVDALLQLTHARYFAAGQLGGPPIFAEGFWHMQNSLVNASGWYSQYPPGHIALLALGFAVGAAWLVGPVVMGIVTALTVLTMSRLLPGREAVARIAGAATGVSPFLVAHSASFMNHSTAALLGVLAVYCALRSERSSLGWAAAAGASVTALAAVRPVAAVVTMLVVIFVWLQPVGDTDAPTPARPLLQRFTMQGALAVLGGLPFLVAHLWYNGVAFGGATVFGYNATWGPSHGLGFHRDPWGNAYGPVEALLYTSADLSALNSSLLETLLPLATLIGVFLMAARVLTRGERVLVLWSLLPVLANAFYWHHGQFMGPRMLTEFAPAWIGLSMVAVHRLLSLAPDSLRGGRFAPRAAGTALVAAAAAAFLVMAPQRVWSYGGEWLPGFRVPLPDAPASSIVFVHGAWEQRIMSRLGSQGVRLDHVETAMRQNPTCLVHRHLSALTAPEAFGGQRPGLAALDLEPSATEYLPRMLVARDARVRVDTTTTLDPACVPEVRADRFGAIDASFILWLGDLPGIEEGRPMFARDLGPAMNRRLLQRYPDRSAWLYGYFADDGTARLLPYAEGEALLWGASR